MNICSQDNLEKARKIVTDELWKIRHFLAVNKNWPEKDLIAYREQEFRLTKIVELLDRDL